MRVLRVAILWALTALANGPPALADAPRDSTATDPLAALNAPAWIPERPVRPAETWESVLRAPGYLVSLPFRWLGRATESGLLYVEDENLVPILVSRLALPRALGLAALPASLGDRTGLGAGLTFSPPVVGRHLALEASASTRGYNRDRVGGFAGPLRVLYVSEWRPRERFVGLGMDADADAKSAYATRSQALRLIAVYPYRRGGPAMLQTVDGVVVHPTAPRDEPLRTQLAVWAGPQVTKMTTGRDPDDPSLEVLFPEFAASMLGRRTERLVYGVRISHDARHGRPHWTGGWRAAFEAERHDRPIRAFALEDAHTGGRSFTRLSWEAEGGFSFGRDPRTVRLLLRAVDQRPDRAGGALWIPDLESLGGHAGLAGFGAGRFHDVDLALARLGYILPLGKNLEFEWRFEAGGVFPDLVVLRPDRLETSYAGLLRLRTDQGMMASAGLAWSHESIRFKFSIGGVE